MNEQIILGRHVRPAGSNGVTDGFPATGATGADALRNDRPRPPGHLCDDRDLDHGRPTADDRAFSGRARSTPGASARGARGDGSRPLGDPRLRLRAPIVRGVVIAALGLGCAVATGCRSAPDDAGTDEPATTASATEPRAPEAVPNNLSEAIAAADEPGVLEVDCRGWSPERDPARTMSYHGAAWLERPERIDEENPPALIAALDLEAGMNVADIGAGIGYHSALIAPEIAPGTVFATDIQPEMLEMLRERVDTNNVETILVTDQTSTGLERDSIDLALMVDVYHELSEPRAVLDDLRGALRPDGRLVLVEFRADDPDVPIKPEHAMTVHQATCELEHYGWSLVSRYDELPWQHVLLFEPPSVE